MPTPTRVIIPHSNREEISLTDALACAVQILSETPPNSGGILLLTHTKNQLEGTSLATFLGSCAKTLQKGASVNVSNFSLRHVTQKTIQPSAHGGVIIAFYADDGMLEQVDGIKDITGVVVVPSDRSQICSWEERWNPIVLGEPQRMPTPLINDSVVSKALTELTNRINLSSAILHPSDKNHAEETIRILRAKGHNLDAQKISSWAIQNNWHPKTAAELGKIVSKVMKLNP